MDLMEPCMFFRSGRSSLLDLAGVEGSVSRVYGLEAYASANRSRL